MRTTLAFFLFVIAGGLVVLSYGALRYLWADYQDSPDYVYLGVAAIEWGVATVAVVGGVLLLRHR